MQTTPSWAKALQISKASIEEWLTVAPIEESFTFWCLFTGRLPLSNYFGWAMDHYGLAYLEAEYFKQDPNRDLWKQIHSVANWSPWMLPIEQWDGVVFIACVEPPTDMQWSFPVSFVLADPNMLEHLWQRLHSASETSNATATMTAVAPSLPSTETATPTENEEVEVADVAPVQAMPVPAPVPVSAPEQPTAVTTVTVTVNPAAAKLQPQNVPPPIPKLKDEDMPLGLTKTQSMENDGSPAGLNLNGLKLGNPGVVPASKVDLNIPESPVPLKVNTSAPPPPAFAIKLDMPEAAAPQMPPAPTAKRTAATPQVATTTPSVEVSGMNAGPVALAQAPADIEAAKTDDECLAWFFKQMRTRYQSGLALIFSKNSLLPWKWESTIAVKNPNTVVTFDTPSLFRITARTMRPYHGYVVENPVHQDFFASWGFSKLPVHVTGVPIVIGGTFRGMFVCTSNEPMANDALEFLERMADKAVVKMESLGTTFQKKAA